MQCEHGKDVPTEKALDVCHKTILDSRFRGNDGRAQLEAG